MFIKSSIPPKMKRKYKEFEELQNKSFPITSGSSKVLLCEKYAPKLEVMIRINQYIIYELYINNNQIIINFLNIHPT